MIPSKRPISDGLLKLTVETKIEAGASSASIYELVESFASYHDQGPNLGGEIVEFLGVEDIPDDRRGTFLTALLSLPEDRSRELRQKMADHASPRLSLPSALIGKAMEILRVRAQPI